MFIARTAGRGRIDASALAILTHHVSNVARQLGIAIDDAAPNEMDIYLTRKNDGDFLVFTLKAELKCANADDKRVSVWEHKQQVASISTKVKPQLFPHLLQQSLKEKLPKFFGQFATDVRNARAKVDAK